MGEEHQLRRPYPAGWEDPRGEILSSQEVAGLVAQVTETYRKAAEEFGRHDAITVKLDAASGFLDEAWHELLELERERGE